LQLVVTPFPRGLRELIIWLLLAVAVVEHGTLVVVAQVVI
jgi:hypothetical protein